MAIESFAQLVEQHYSALRRIAERSIRARSYPASMSPTSLVAESVMRLLQQRERPMGEAHLRGLATVFMARVLADSAKSRMRQKRGGGLQRRSLADPSVSIELGTHARACAGSGTPADGTAIDRDELLGAMERVAEVMPRAMEIVTLHLVADIPLARTAELVGVSERTAYRDLQEGRKALADELRRGAGDRTGA
jgi:RNA polymerase sigma factor (sigma-70 family)